MALSYLYPPEIQFQSQAGVNNTAGFLRVFYTQTDDRAPTYSDFGGTLNEADIVLDADGRAVVIVDDTKTYRLEVYNRNRGLMFTCDPVTAMGGSGGGSVGTKIVSTDGSVNITVSSGGGITVYDLSTVLTQDAAKWGVTNVLRSFTDGDGSWEQMPLVSSVGSAAYSDGWTAECAQAYDLEACIEIQSGSATATSMLDARFDVEVDGVVVKSQYGSLDPTRPMDRVTFGWKGELAEGQVVNGRLFVKTDEAMNIGLLGHVMYNAEVDGVVGSGGGGGGNEYYAGQYIEISTGNFISVTGVAPAGNYVYKNEISAQSSLWNTVSGKEDKVNWGLSGNTVTSINGHDLAGADYSAGQYVDISGNVISVTGLQPSGDYAYNSAVSSKVDRSAFDSCCSSMENAISSLSSTVSGLTGQYVEISAISAESSVWNSASAISSITADVTSLSSDLSSLSSTVSGLTGQYVEQSSISAQSSVWNSASAVSSKVDQSAFDSCCSAMSGAVSSLQGDVSAISGTVSSLQVDVSAISAVVSGISGDYIQYAALETASGMITGISGTALAGGGHEYSGVWPVVVDNDQDIISAANKPLCVDETMTGYESAGSAVIGVNTSTVLSGLNAYQLTADMSGYQPSGDYAYNSAVSGKQDASAMTAYQLSGDYAYNSSLADYQPVSGMTAYQPSGDYLVPDDISGKADVSSLTAYQEITGMSAYQLSGDYAYNSSVSSKMDASASSEFYPMTGNPSSFLVADDITGKADASALSDYQPVSAMTAYQPSGDYAYNSAVSGKADSSALTAYQEISGMTAYQPSGDYAFNSSLSSKLDQSALELTGEWVSGIELSGSSYKLYAGWATEASMAQTAYYDSEGNDLNAYVHALSANSGDWNSVSAKQDTSAMTAYQEISGMTAYQPAGTYIYESALGWAEV